jgi:hypothetical protein
VETPTPILLDQTEPEATLLDIVGVGGNRTAPAGPGAVPPIMPSGGPGSVPYSPYPIAPASGNGTMPTIPQMIPPR